jgi:hypothetical protein
MLEHYLFIIYLFLLCKKEKEKKQDSTHTIIYMNSVQSSLAPSLSLSLFNKVNFFLHVQRILSLGSVLF